MAGNGLARRNRVEHAMFRYPINFQEGAAIG
jgi:hypothetical protein